MRAEEIFREVIASGARIRGDLGWRLRRTGAPEIFLIQATNQLHKLDRIDPWGRVSVAAPSEATWGAVKLGLPTSK